MPRSDDIYRLPPYLPVPIDDGACNHLAGARLPSVVLPSTSGGRVEVAVQQKTAEGASVPAPRRALASRLTTNLLADVLNNERHSCPQSDDRPPGHPPPLPLLHHAAIDPLTEPRANTRGSLFPQPGDISNDRIQGTFLMAVDSRPRRLDGTPCRH